MKRPGSLVGLGIAVVVLLVAISAMLGWAVGDQTASKTKTVTSSNQAAMSAPPGHMGANLAVGQIGDPTRGARLWDSKRCSDCHSYGGQGGEDAPSLDFMRGHMSAREIADMSGQIWDHMPAMLQHFREEKIPVPTFTQGEMADMIAFLHSGKGAKAGPSGHQGMTGMSEMGGHMSGSSGKGVFLSAGCGTCHTLAAASTHASVGPNLDNALKAESVAFVRESILDPDASIAAGYQAGVMPTTYRNQLTMRQIAALVAFLSKQQ